MENIHNHSRSKSLLSNREFLITSIKNRSKTLPNDSQDFNLLTKSKISTNSFKTLNNKFTLPNVSNNLSKLTTNITFHSSSSLNTKINLKKLRNFIKPSLKCLLEKNKINELKKRLEKKRFTELHKYKLKINPNNLFHDYGLSNYIKIKSSLNFFKKRQNIYHNNISSYNHKKIEEKKTGSDLLINPNLIVKRNNISKCVRLTNVPSKDTNILNNFMFKTLSSDETEKNLLENIEDKNEILGINDSMFRKRNINDFIETSSSMYFFKKFSGKSRTLGKLIKKYKYN